MNALRILLSKSMRGLSVLAVAITGTCLLSCNSTANVSQNDMNKDALAQIGFYKAYNWNGLVDAFIALSKEAAKHNTSPDALTLEQLLGLRDKSAVFSRLDDGTPRPVAGLALVEDTAAVDSIIAKYGPEFLPKDLKLAWGFKPYQPTSDSKGQECYELIVLKTTDGKPYMTGETIVAAEKEPMPDGRYCIMFTFDEAGKQQFAQLTASSVGGYIADVINDKVYSYPMVVSEVPGGKVQVVGPFSEEDIDNLLNFIYGVK